MDAFLTELTQAIQATVLKSLSAKIQQFADAVSKASDGKLTAEQVMTVWNTMHPEAKAGDKSPTQRTKTDKARKCQTIKQSGKDKGGVCGKNCVVGKDTCVSHTPKETTAAPAAPAATTEKKDEKPTATAAPAAKTEAPAAPAAPAAALEVKIGTDDQLKAMKVDDLKNLLRSAKINFGSKDRKDTLIALLVKARDTASAAPAPAPTLPTAAPAPAPTLPTAATAHDGHDHTDEEVVEEEADELVLEDQ